MLKFNNIIGHYSAKVGLLKVGLLLSVLAALLLAGCQSEESVYDRVQATGEIRASYAVYPPYFIQDANTGDLSGIFFEALNEVGGRLNLKVKWIEPVGWGEIFEGLNSNRHDIFGAGLWKNEERSKVGDFSLPLFCNSIKIYGRPNETRFKARTDINRPEVRISVQDGEATSYIAASDYPKAQQVSITQLNPWTDVLLNVISGKADVTFAEPSTINRFLDKNPGQLKNLLPEEHIRLFANAYALKLGEPKFKKMLNAALEEIRKDGTLEAILRKYEVHPGEFVRREAEACAMLLTNNP